MSHLGYSGQLPRIEMHPREGMYATRPLFEAGLIPDETVSSSIPNAAKLAAVAAADPLEDPDVKAAVRYSALYGLSALPYTPLCIPPAAIGGIFVLPIRIAPASLSLLTVPRLQ